MFVFPPTQIAELKNNRSLALISGGPDSTLLFHALVKARDEHGVAFEVLHVNHGLRGAASDGDEGFVRDLCARHCVVCHVRHLELKDATGNLQDVARRARIQICFELQRDVGVTRILTGHHQDDVIETLVMRQSRGAGLRGSVGIRRVMWRKNHLVPQCRLAFVRPLLDFCKADILGFLNSQHLDFRVDASNLTGKYLRNRVRLFLDNAKEKDPHWSEARARLCALARLAGEVDSYLEMRLTVLQKSYRHFVPLADWMVWPEELRFRFFATKLRAKGFLKEVQARHFKLLEAERTNFVLGKAYVFKDEGGVYFYSRTELRFLDEVKTLGTPGTFRFSSLDRILSLRILKRQTFADHLLQRAPGILYVDADKITFPLNVTTSRSLDFSKRHEEFLIPFGRQGKLGLKELLQARHVPLYARHFLPVLRLQSGEIVAVAEVEISARFAIDENTTRVLEIQVRST